MNALEPDYTPTQTDEIDCSNYFEQIDYAALEEAEAILNGDLPSSPETYAMVAKWYGR